MHGTGEGLGRREALAAAGSAAAAGLAGCVEPLGVWREGEGPPEPLSLSISILPSDEDPVGADIGRRLTEHLQELGVDASVSPRTGVELHRRVLVEHDFDAFVAPTPPVDDPDVLHGWLHSSFADDVGWLNPFGVESDSIDARLTAQDRVDGEDRRNELDALQEDLIERQPLSVVARADELTAYGPTLPAALRPAGLTRAGDLLGLGDAETVDRTVRVGLLDGSVTQQLNPLLVPFAPQSIPVDLVYDSLVRYLDGQPHHWAAADVAWDSDHTGRQAATVTLRDGLQWHDGEPVTAADVAFTYAFLRDLTRGGADRPIPAPRFGVALSHLESVAIVDERTLAFTFGRTHRRSARRALAVPILPEHEWASRTAMDEDGIPVALDRANLGAVGSGPLRVDEVDPDSTLRLVADDAHFAVAGGDGAAIAPRELRLAGVTFEVPTRPPAPGALIDLAAEGDLDAIANLPPAGAADATGAAGVDLAVRPSGRYYVIGFNQRRPPFDDVTLRRLVARMVDRTFTVALMLRGYGAPADTPLAGTDFAADDLTWDGQSRVGAFPGVSGILDVARARELFEDADVPLEEARTGLFGE